MRALVFILLAAPAFALTNVEKAAILEAAGDVSVSLYQAQAACAGVEHPKLLPEVRIIARDRFRCGSASPTGLCSGLHTRRRITLTTPTDAWPHELLHAVLCQTHYGCDPDHKSPLWQTCLVPPEAS
jgi:hypothetical protein